MVESAAVRDISDASVYPGTLAFTTFHAFPSHLLQSMSFPNCISKLYTACLALSIHMVCSFFPTHSNLFLLVSQLFVSDRARDVATVLHPPASGGRMARRSTQQLPQPRTQRQPVLQKHNYLLPMSAISYISTCHSRADFERHNRPPEGGNKP
jgi:hypothetical protein